MESSIPVTPSTSERRPKWDVLLLTLLAVSLSLNVFLGWKLKGLSNNGNAAPPAPLAEGTAVASFEAYDISDRQETINCRGVSTVLYIFSPSCSWCERNLDNIKTLVSLRGDTYRFVGLSLNNTNLVKYLESSKLNFPTYTKLSRDTIENLKLSSTPQTIVVSPEGKVIKNWVGAFGDKLRPEVESFFGVQLPGINSEGLSNTSDKSCP